MIFHVYEDKDGNPVLRVDEEAIGYLIMGLEELRDCEPGTELAAPSLKMGEDGNIESMGDYILLRAEDN